MSLEARDGVRLCDGLTRREVLRAGGIALGGLTLPDLLRLQAGAKAGEGTAEARGPKFGKAKSVILFCTNGGTAQMDSFDPKPDAPAEVRGPYKPIATSVPGVTLNEFLPRLAKLQHKTALLRAIHHNQTLHPTAIYLTLCGDLLGRVVTPDSATMSREHKPHFGSVLTKLLPVPPDLPGFVMMPEAMAPTGRSGPGSSPASSARGMTPTGSTASRAAPASHPGRWPRTSR